jgi:hypothetical protein
MIHGNGGPAEDGHAVGRHDQGKRVRWFHGTGRARLANVLPRKAA